MQSETFIYIPQEAEEMQFERTKKALIQGIIEMLPKINLPLNGIKDYPSLDIHALDQFGVDYHKNRAVFVIGGIAFFCRYQNDWNGTLMWGNRMNESTVTWQSDVGRDLLEKIHDAIQTKPNLSHEDICSFFLQCGKKC